MRSSLRVAHIITGLGVGGAETMLYRLLSDLGRETQSSLVISLGDEGFFASRFREVGIPVRTLNMNPKFPNPLKILRLRGWLREFRPDLVQTWMYHADLIGSLAAPFAGDIPVVWGIHKSTLETNSITYTHLVRWVSALISNRLPSAIIACSARAKEVHVQLGYPKEKITVIPNGFDLQQFRPNLSHRKEIRDELGISKNAIVIGTVARFHPQKDYRNFIKAIGILTKTKPGTHYLLCGEGVSVGNKTLTYWLDEENLSDKVYLLGLRNDITRLLNAMDIFTLSSAYGEGFPLVVGEAMATGLPCVVTDVGDSAYLVGSTGSVLPPNNPGALAAAWSDLQELSLKQRQKLGAKARKRIQDHFSIAKIRRDYDELYMSVHQGLFLE